MGILSVRTPLCKITSTGEIEQWFRRAASMKVVQFLKLDACQSDGCVLWQQNFVVQCKDQLTISLIYATLTLLLVFSHKLIIKQKDEQATPFFGETCSSFLFSFRALFCNAPDSFGFDIVRSRAYRSRSVWSSWRDRSPNGFFRYSLYSA